MARMRQLIHGRIPSTMRAKALKLTFALSEIDNVIAILFERKLYID